jgi:Fe-S-cluster containining protein
MNLNPNLQENKALEDIFTCRMCGDCCQGFGGTYVSNDDIASISAFIGMDVHDFTKKYCVPSGSRFVLAQKEDGFCVFFTDKCSIHPVKPLMCRRWPFIPSLLRDFDNWRIMAGQCPGINPEASKEEVLALVCRQMGL